MLLLYSSNQVEVSQVNFPACGQARGAQVSAGVEAEGNIPAHKLAVFN